MSLIFIILNIESAFFDLLNDHWPFGTALFMVAIVSGWLATKIARIYFRFERTEGDCNSLIVTTTEMSRNITAIDKKLSIVIAHLGNLGLKANSFDINSPIELNETGLKILDLVGGRKYVDDHKTKLIGLMELKGLESGLDVQTYAMVLILESFEDRGFLPVKNYIFQNPTYKITDTNIISLDLPFITQVLGIYLRDKYFEKYPGLKKGSLT